MVTKAIERAQTTVEQRNAEIRKNVLKYDEVMNEQRKVIYQRRDQILEGVRPQVGGDGVPRRRRRLADRARTASAPPTTNGISTDWPRSSRRSGRTRSPSPARRCGSTDEIYDLVMVGCHGATTSGARQELGAEVMREVERQVMLRIIDQRWREHLEEMDYLQGGINLRAMGQKDPLTEWQREGLRDVRRDDEGHRPGLREVRDARPGGPEPGTGADADEAPAVQNLADVVVRRPVEASGFDQAAQRAAVAEGSARPPTRCRHRRRQAADRRQGRLREDSRGMPRARAARARSSSSATAPTVTWAGNRRHARLHLTTSRTSSVASTRRRSICRSATTVNGSSVLEAEVVRPDAVGRPGAGEEAQRRVRQHQ